MKTTIKSNVLLIIMLFACLQAQAHDFEVGGIYYGISIFNKNTAYVTHQGTGYNDYKEYSGSVVIPESVTYNGKSYTVASIGGYAFYGCDELTSVTIPGTVNTINQNAFNGCTGLIYIECRAITPPTCGTNVFSNVNIEEIPLSVPNVSVSAYKSANTWKDFGTITAIGGGPSGLNYIIISPTEVEVTLASPFYAGDIVIPSQTTINGKTYTVTGIGVEAFCNCRNLTSVSIPSTVTSIGSYAFENCTALTAVYISDLEAWCKIDFSDIEANPLYSGGNLYLNNELLTNLEIPNTITEIESFAFSGCKSITSVNIHNSVTTIGTRAFYGCSELTSVRIGNFVTNIGNSTFENTGWYNNQPNGILYLDKYCLGYKGDKPIGVLTLKEDTRLIASSAFYDCRDLTRVTIGYSVTSIGISAFSYCYGLTSVTSLSTTPPTCETNVFGGVNTQNIPLTVPSESISAYKVADTWKDFGTITGMGGGQEASELNYNIISDTEVEVIAGETKYTGDIVIPSETSIDGNKYTVSRIGANAFYKCTGITSVTIPNSVTTIGSYAFYGCDALTNITIPNTVTSIGGSAFYNTGWYNNQPTGILYLDKYCLGYKGMDPTGTLTLKGDTRLIAGSAFSSCDGLTSVTIPNSVTTIGSSAFYGCDGLTNVTIPESVTSIELCAFENCDGLTSVTIGNSVTIIGNQVFNDCDALTSVTIPESVTHIGYYAFGRCDVLMSIVVESGNTIYDSRDSSNAIIETATNTLITGCKTTIIPNSVTSIGIGAFIGCHGLTHVVIPESVTSIGVGVFYNCTGLKSVTSLNPTPPACDADVFAYVDTQSIPLSVPAESVSAYKSADIWKDFGSITGDANITYGTAISGVENVHKNEVTESIEYYNLNGVRVQNPKKGIYIKKVEGKISKVIL